MWLTKLLALHFTYNAIKSYICKKGGAQFFSDTFRVGNQSKGNVISVLP